MLWQFFKNTTPDRVTPAVVLAYAHGVGLSGKPPSPVTIAARIACLSSYFRFLIRMGMVASNPCDLVERPRVSPSPARGYSADEVRRLLDVVPDTVQGRRDRAILLVFVLTGRRRAEVLGTDQNAVPDATGAPSLALTWVQTWVQPHENGPSGSPGGAISSSDVWSGRLDLNQRPLDPQSSALPGCATPRTVVS